MDVERGRAEVAWERNPNLVEPLGDDILGE